MAEAPKPKTPEEFIAMINKAYDANIASCGERTKQIIRTARFSSGILSLDEALGGGWPFCRVVLTAGDYSTGKTEIALQAMRSIQDYDRVTKKHKLLLPEGAPFTKCRAMFVDAENALDLKWVESKGIDINLHTILRPETSEQAIDIITTAIDLNMYDLILLDSIAQMTPIGEIETSVEDWQMGLAARLNNKAFRKWNAMLAKRSVQKLGGPLVLCLNQLRYKIGKDAMFGDPRVLPGGRGQDYCTSIILYTRSGKYDNKDEAVMSQVELGGTCWKNKTYIPKQTFAYTMALKDTEHLKKGQVENVPNLVKRGRELNLITKEGVNHIFAQQSYGNVTQFESLLYEQPVLNLKLWRSIIAAQTGYQ